LKERGHISRVGSDKAGYWLTNRKWNECISRDNTTCYRKL
jgi:hypothetical protein